MGRAATHLAYKPEQAVDLDTGAVVAAEIHCADEGDTTTISKTLDEGKVNLTEVGGADFGQSGRMQRRQEISLPRGFEILR